MSLSVVAFLVLAFAWGSLTAVNAGLIAIVAAYAVGVLLAGLSVAKVTAQFPANLFFILLGTTLLFSIVRVTGTIDLLGSSPLRGHGYTAGRLFLPSLRGCWAFTNRLPLHSVWKEGSGRPEIRFPWWLPDLAQPVVCERRSACTGCIFELLSGNRISVPFQWTGALLRAVILERRLTVLLVTHDPALAAGMAARQITLGDPPPPTRDRRSAASKPAAVEATSAPEQTSP